MEVTIRVKDLYDRSPGGGKRPNCGDGICQTKMSGKKRKRNKLIGMRISYEGRFLRKRQRPLKKGDPGRGGDWLKGCAFLGKEEGQTRRDFLLLN